MQERIGEARQLLGALGLPKEQQNERAALTLLGLLELRPSDPWETARDPLMGVTPTMEFAAEHYGVKWAPNTRETVRRFTLHQFVEAGVAVPNPDEPDRPTNSPKYCYQIALEVLNLVRQFGSPIWVRVLRDYLKQKVTLAERYRQMRRMRQIPLQLAPDKQIYLSPSGQNELVRRILEEFAPRFTPGAYPIYIGDTRAKWA